MPDRIKVGRVISSVGGRITTLLTGLLAAALIIYSGYVLYDTFYIQKNAGNSWDLVDLRPQIIEDIGNGDSPLSSSLAQINEDYRAWLTIYDTNIDYPVMQGPNNLYYASHDIYKKSSLTGGIYLAAENSRDLSDNYNLIYGHHMDENLLFGGLDNFKDTDYFNAHKEGVLIASDSIYDLEIFAVISTDAYDGMIYDPGNRDLTDLMEYISGKAVQMDSGAADGISKIVAFSTCEAAETNGRLVVFAKMVLREQDDEQPEDENAITPGGGETPDAPDAPNPPNAPDDGTPAVPEGTAPQIEIAEANMAGNAGADVFEVIEDAGSPLAHAINNFRPAGGSYGDRAWALVNLVCVILTIYLLIPLARIKGKVNRVKTMLKLNELRSEAAEQSSGNSSDVSDEKKKINRFRVRLIIGFALEVIIAAAAVIIFILTENMRLPMVLIDKWTPVMLAILLICWIADLILVRSHRRNDEEEMKEQLAV